MGADVEEQKTGFKSNGQFIASFKSERQKPTLTFGRYGA
jgi:hypothetical protein